MTAKNILTDVINAFCLSSQNLDKVYKLSGIKAKLYNGKRSNEQLRKILIRAISEDKAKEIVNQMPFPYIETAFGDFIKTNDAMYWIDEVLAPLEKKNGYRIESAEGYSIFYR